MYVLINWSRVCPRSVYQHKQEIKSILNVLYHNQSNGSKCVIDVCRTWPAVEKTDLGYVRQQSVTWDFFLIEHVVNVKTLNGSEHDGRSFFSFVFIEIENLINWLHRANEHKNWMIFFSSNFWNWYFLATFCPVNSTTINKEESCWYTTISSWHNQFKQTKILCTLYLLNFHNFWLKTSFRNQIAKTKSA